MEDYWGWMLEAGLLLYMQGILLNMLNWLFRLLIKTVKHHFWKLRISIFLLILLPCKIITPIETVKDRKCQREENPRKNINFFGSKFKIFHPEWEPVCGKTRGQNWCWRNELCSFNSSKQRVLEEVKKDNDCCLYSRSRIIFI